MRKPFLLLTSAVVVACRPVDARPRVASATAFVGVNVVPMTRATVLPDQTVLIRDGRIATVGPRARVTVPSGTQVIEGRGKFLMPGLADLHTHFMRRGDLTQYIANGVTTVLDMGTQAADSLLAWRDSTAAGTIVGPTIFISFFIDGTRGRGTTTSGRAAVMTESVAEVRDGVRRAKREGFDYIKAYGFLADSVYLALAHEAERQGIGIVGHGIRSIGMERGLAAGQVLVAHGEEYFYTFFGGNADPARIPEAIAFTKKHRATVLPNLSAYDAITRQWAKPPVVDSFLARPNARYLDPFWLDRWRRADYITRPGSLGNRIEFLKRLAKAFADSGIPLVLGTDSPTIPGVPPGFSIHDEMRLLIEAGLSPYQVLVAGTRTAGEFIARTRSGADRFGAVEPGMRADLVLLDRNPLENMAAAATPAGVMVRGHWLSRAEIDRQLERLKRP
jgi:imidazolonepropionase-like amidohydrolase